MWSAIEAHPHSSLVNSSTLLTPNVILYKVIRDQFLKRSGRDLQERRLSHGDEECRDSAADRQHTAKVSEAWDHMDRRQEQQGGQQARERVVSKLRGKQGPRCGGLSEGLAESPGLSLFY